MGHYLGSLVLLTQGVEVEANVRGLGSAAEVDLSFVEAFRQASDQVAENDERAARRAAQERVKANEEAAKEFEEPKKKLGQY